MGTCSRESGCSSHGFPLRAPARRRETEAGVRQRRWPPAAARACLARGDALSVELWCCLLQRGKHAAAVDAPKAVGAVLQAAAALAGGALRCRVSACRGGVRADPAAAAHELLYNTMTQGEPSRMAVSKLPSVRSRTGAWPCCTSARALAARSAMSARASIGVAWLTAGAAWLMERFQVRVQGR